MKGSTRTIGWSKDADGRKKVSRASRCTRGELVQRACTTEGISATGGVLMGIESLKGRKTDLGLPWRIHREDAGCFERK
jgi:hypothetical protein